MRTEFELNQESQSARGIRAFVPGALLLFAFAAYAVSSLTTLQRGKGGLDFSVFYRAGQMWLRGENPYLSEAFAYAYPPNAAPWFMAYACLPAGLAQGLHACLNTLAIGLMFVLYVKWFSPKQAWTELTLSRAIALSVVLVSPLTTKSVHLGQLSLIVAALLFWGWYFIYERRSELLGGLLLGLGSVKPQLAMLFFVWLLIDRQWRALGVACVVGALSLLPVLAILGLEGTVTSWQIGIQHYAAAYENLLGSPGVLTLSSAFVYLGLPAWVALALLAAGSSSLYWRRAEIPPRLLIVALPFLALVTLYSHDCDYVALNLVWLRLFDWNRTTRWVRLAACASLLAYFVPFRVLQLVHPGFPLVRILPLAVVAGLFMFEELGSSQRPAAPGPRPKRTVPAPNKKREYVAADAHV